MIRIKVKDFVSTAFSYSDAEIVRLEMDKYLKAGENVTVDFSEIDNFTALFLKVALTEHLSSMSVEEYNQRIQVENLTDLEELVYTQCFKTAAKFYSLTPEEKEIRLQCINEAMEELGGSY
ncbi:STAS-like domain-containing protein [Methanolapillus ohkumae]|uniref:DUF4325 domain-containing protein n=1 Tax=Methanolapillus ohkumae TaxID=3028298 RepID=A0AA96ZW67_9EURY|nr:hypothetical protein MsAm2_14680 [Methanosarcinaceae archaeon Am2]